MIIALASPRVMSSIAEGLTSIEHAIATAAGQRAAVVCFPEAYMPGLRGLDYPVADYDETHQDSVIAAVSQWSKQYAIHVILGCEWHQHGQRHIAAMVFNSTGKLLGIQTKNQLAPTEDALYSPGNTRHLFLLDRVAVGVVICHEGFRYPETVRWAAMRGAQLVFHQHCTGSDQVGPTLTSWGSMSNPYYEKAMLCRALENHVWFASVNYAFRYQESATSVIDPDGQCVAHLPYGTAGILVQDIDLNQATRIYADRFAPERYHDDASDV